MICVVPAESVTFKSHNSISLHMLVIIPTHTAPWNDLSSLYSLGSHLEAKKGFMNNPLIPVISHMIRYTVINQCELNHLHYSYSYLLYIQAKYRIFIILMINLVILWSIKSSSVAEP